MTIHVTHQVDVTGGVRYSHDSQTAIQNASGLLAGSLPEQTSDEGEATYLAGLRYRPTDNIMAYFRFATGYRPGGINVVANGTNGQPLASPTFQSDHLYSYEGGLKATTPDHRYSIDADVYLIDWDNVQISALRNNVGILVNAPSAESKGAELTLTATPINKLTLTSALGFIDAELTADSPDLGGKKGDSLPDSPKFTAAVSGDYAFQVVDFNSFVGGTLRYVGSRVAAFNDSPSTPQYRLPDYTATDLRAGVFIQDARVEFFVKNVFDSRGQLSAGTAFAVIPGGAVRVSILEPRTIGFDVSRKF